MDIAVLAGGRSPEYDVSLRSAAQVLRHLDRSRWRVWPVHLDRDGGWWPRREPLAEGADWDPNDGTCDGPLRPGRALDNLLERAAIGAVFPVLHGPFGEDGSVQGMLALHDLPCVGPDHAASAVALDKLRARAALAAVDVPMPRAYVSHMALADCNPRIEFAALEATIGSPAFVKADKSGSTVGVREIATAAELGAFCEEFRATFRRWYAEEHLIGEEITVGVLGNTGGELEVLPAIGIYPRDADYFTHEAKYTPGATDEVIPPRGLSHLQLAEVGELAKRCHQALVCDGMSRTDMIVTEDGPKVLEVNTIPGLTAESLLPQAAGAAGYSFRQLLNRLLDLALEHDGVAAKPAAGFAGAAAPAAMTGVAGRSDLESTGEADAPAVRRSNSATAPGADLDADSAVGS
ncbi:MAG: hypothetical protein NXI31_17415 [bacterium]|nr:hypothetical protein [bacterium]